MAREKARGRRPRQNRVTPLGRLIAVPARGTLMGNRGRLHDARGRLTGRRWTTRAWLCCLLEFKGRRRRVMAPGRYTELFFLDEATALAAGHRPCGECRRASHAAFKLFWLRANAHLLPGGEFTLAALDRVLHDERVARWERQQTWVAPLDALPDGAMVLLEDPEQPWLVRGGELLRWTPAGYRERIPCPAGVLGRLVTPPSIVSVLASGYPAEVHPSAESAPRRGRRAGVRRSPAGRAARRRRG